MSVALYTLLHVHDQVNIFSYSKQASSLVPAVLRTPDQNTEPGWA